MTRRVLRAIAILLLLLLLVAAVAQQTTNAAPSPNPAAQTPPKPPDMVCWGSNPSWSIQFVSWGAHYLGINQPDQDFAGAFFWVPEDQVWAWHRTSEFGAPNGLGLSAIIKKQSCTDSVRKETFPWTAHVNLPEGDMVNGCCRQLKPGEAAVGPHGVPPKPQQ